MLHNALINTLGFKSTDFLVQNKIGINPVIFNTKNTIVIETHVRSALSDFIVKGLISINKINVVIIVSTAQVEVVYSDLRENKTGTINVSYQVR